MTLAEYLEKFKGRNKIKWVSGAKPDFTDSLSKTNSLQEHSPSFFHRKKTIAYPKFGARRAR